MNKDEITDIIFHDELITTYGSFNLSSSGLRKINTISERMRLLGKLLKELRSKTGQSKASLSDIIKPEQFELFLTCTKTLGGFTMTTAEGEPVTSFTKPSGH